jgi:hypothetical protein
MMGNRIGTARVKDRLTEGTQMRFNKSGLSSRKKSRAFTKIGGIIHFLPFGYQWFYHSLNVIPIFPEVSSLSFGLISRCAFSPGFIVMV